MNALLLVALFSGIPFSSAAPSADAWKATVYGEDWKVEDARVKEKIPALKKHEGIKPTDADMQWLKTLAKERRAQVDAALDAYYINLGKVTPHWATAKHEIFAAREVDGYILLWVQEPEIKDGGRSVIYSKEKDKIVSDFWDGGIRG